MTREEKIELLNKLLEIEEKNDIGNLTRAERGEFQQWINDAIEQEPKTGHWREDIDNNRKWDRVRFYCSECGGWQTYGRTHYCPNCGAKMEESEETE